MIPELEPHCGSWIVSRRSSGTVIGEFFSRETVERFNAETCLIETTAQYLGRVNQPSVMREFYYEVEFEDGAKIRVDAANRKCAVFLARYQARKTESDPISRIQRVEGLATSSR